MNAATKLACALLAAAVSWSCAPVTATGPNAVGIHLARASYDPEGPDPEPDEVALSDASGVRVTYGRRFKGSRTLWLGPEIVAGWVSESRVSAPRADLPAGVSRAFVATLLRVLVFPRASSQGTTESFVEEAFDRIGFDFGVGLAYGAFSEAQRNIDGTPNLDPRTDHEIGPVFSFGLSFQLSTHVMVSGDFLVLAFEPELSFPWPGRFADKVVGGGGLVVVF